LDDDRNFDIVTLRRPRRVKLSNWFGSSFRWIAKCGWIQVEAEVQECLKPTRTSIHKAPYYLEPQLLAGENLIAFTYSVEGKTYTGILSSKDEVQKGDKFPIRCNPRNPAENNSMDSKTNWTVSYTKILDVVLIALFLALIVWNYFLNK